MRTKLLATAACILGFATAAPAQFQNGPYPGAYGGGYPGGGYGGYGGYGNYGGNGAFNNAGPMMPNIYNPRTQPLSPYLNMFRGSNPAAGYYFGTRPGTVGGGSGMYGGAPNIAMGGNRAPFLPQLATGPEPFSLTESDTGNGSVFPPAGHPVMFNNTMGYFPGSFGSGMRPGLSGFGTNRTQQHATPKPKK